LADPDVTGIRFARRELLCERGHTFLSFIPPHYHNPLTLPNSYYYGRIYTDTPSVFIRVAIVTGLR
jgi:hypothetical protein